MIQSTASLTILALQRGSNMKKLLLSLFAFLFLSFFSMANANATTWYACSGGGNWNGGSTWTSIIGDETGCIGALGNPVAGDTAILNSTSGNITITAAAAAAVITETGYTGTLAFGTQTLTVTGLCTILGAMTNTSGTLSCAGGVTLGGTATGTFPKLTLAGSSTFTSAGFTWPGQVSIGAFTITLADNATWSGTLTFTGATVLSGAFNINVGGSLTQGSNNITTSGGIPTIIMNGTGTWTGASGNALATNLSFAGTNTVSGSVKFQLGTLKYTSGTVTTTSSTLNIGTTPTLDVSAITWNNITETSTSTTTTLSSNLVSTGTMTIPGGSITFSGAYNISVGTLIDSSVNISTTLTIPASQTLTVSTAIQLEGNSTHVFNLVSGTSSTAFNLNYTGTLANQKIYNVAFTDVNASGSTYGLNNFNGSTLTRTTNITNVTAANFAACSGGGFFNP